MNTPYAPYTDQTVINYGKHAGQKLANIPADYLIWLYENDKCNAPMRAYIKDNLEVLKAEIKQKAK